MKCEHCEIDIFENEYVWAVYLFHKIVIHGESVND